MIMTCGLAIFAKTIGLSQVKTRLAADIGRKSAEEFYHLSVRAIEEVASIAADKYGVVPHWALAEEEALGLPDWASFPVLWTGEGGLGARLATISEKMFERHDSVIIIGTDSPQLSPEIFEEAQLIMAQNIKDCVVGPAKDGGFYLFMTQSPVSREAWEMVTYSVATTLENLRACSARRFHRLGIEQDVDVVEDLYSLKFALKNKQEDILPAQKKLLDWLGRYFEVAI